MQISYVKHSAWFVLLIFAAYLAGSGALQGLSYYSVYSEVSAAAEYPTFDKTAHLTPVIQAGQLFSITGEQSSSRECPANASICTAPLSILPPVHNVLFNPAQKERKIRLMKSFLASQLFVFQEPHPPRLT